MATTRERAAASAACGSRDAAVLPGHRELTWSGPADQIVEIGIIGHDGSVVFESLVRPTVPIPLDALRVHGISTGMVMSAPGWGEIWPLVVEHLEGWPVAVYNADFDLRLVRQSNRRAGIVSFPGSGASDVSDAAVRRVSRRMGWAAPKLPVAEPGGSQSPMRAPPAERPSGHPRCATGSQAARAYGQCQSFVQTQEV